MVKYLSWLWPVIFFSISLIFVLYAVILTNLLTLSILFSTVVRVPVVAELAMLGISPLTSSILALREALVAKLVITDVLSSIFFILVSYKSFLTTSLFTTSLYLLKPTGAGTNLSVSNLFTLIFKSVKLLGIFFNLSISTSPTSYSKLAKSVFLAKEDVSTHPHILNLFLLHN